MIRVSQRLQRDLPEASLVLQVHDELVLTCPGEQSDAGEGILKNEMEAAMELSVPSRLRPEWGRTGWRPVTEMDMKTTLKRSFIILLLALLPSCGGKKADGINVLLILMDTVRADHFSSYGYHRQTTPFIDSLAAGEPLPSGAGQASWTLPAMTTILSGVTPVEHGAGRTGGIFHGDFPEVPWLPLAFHRSGYRTGAFFNVLFMNEDFGFHRGFQHFDCQGFKSNSSLRNAGETVDDLLGWLDETRGDGPFFAAVHFYDPHIPYDPPSHTTPCTGIHPIPGITATPGEPTLHR